MQAGEATNTYHLCRQLAARGVEVHVLTSVRNTGTDEGRVHIHPIVEKWGWPDLFRIRAFIKGCAPDAVGRACNNDDFSCKVAHDVSLEGGSVPQ